MKKPKNIENYLECVRWVDKKFLYVYCVECENWKQILIRCTAAVEYKQTLSKRVSDCHNLEFLCGLCQADINYLLTENLKAILVKRMDIPIKPGEKDV